MTIATDPTPTVRPSRQVIVGRVLSGLVILALSLDAGGKLLFPNAMIATSPPTGLPADIGFYRLL